MVIPLVKNVSGQLILCLGYARLINISSKDLGVLLDGPEVKMTNRLVIMLLIY